MAEEEGQVPPAAEAAGVADEGAEAAPAEQPDTPTTFLTKLSETLKGTDGVDDDLAGKSSITTCEGYLSTRSIRQITNHEWLDVWR